MNCHLIQENSGSASLYHKSCLIDNKMQKVFHKYLANIQQDLTRGSKEPVMTHLAKVALKMSCIF